MNSWLPRLADWTVIHLAAASVTATGLTLGAWALIRITRLREPTHRYPSGAWATWPVCANWRSLA